MSHETTGTLIDERTVSLDAPLPNGQCNGRVKVVVDVVEPKPARPLLEALAEIHSRQRERGHVPMTVEEVDRYLQAERDSWDNSEEATIFQCEDTRHARRACDAFLC